VDGGLRVGCGRGLGVGFTGVWEMVKEIDWQLFNS
jgi:hypothetical protein